MKKLLILTTVLLGAAGVSQAGVLFNFGLRVPVPAPPVFAAPAPPAYVAPAPDYYGYTGPCYDYSAPCYDYSPYVAPPVFGFGFGDYGHPSWRGGHWGGHSDDHRRDGFHGGFRGEHRGGFAHRR